MVYVLLLINSQFKYIISLLLCMKSPLSIFIKNIFSFVIDRVLDTLSSFVVVLVT